MVATFKWTDYAAPQALLGAELDGLLDGAWALSGALIDNSNGAAELFFYGDAELVLSGVVTVGTGTPSLDLYVLPAPDGTTGPNPPGTVAGAIPAQYRAGSITANAGASFLQGTARGLVLPPGKYLVGCQNNLGVALPANGNTLSLHRYHEQTV